MQLSISTKPSIMSEAHDLRPMRRSLRALLCLGILALAQQTMPATSTPAIESAVVNAATNQITITGMSLAPASGAPTVKLDNTQLALVTYSSTAILAKLPAGLGTGTFDLTVSTGSNITG